LSLFRLKGCSIWCLRCFIIVILLNSTHYRHFGALTGELLDGVVSFFAISAFIFIEHVISHITCDVLRILVNIVQIRRSIFYQISHLNEWSSWATTAAVTTINSSCIASSTSLSYQAIDSMFILLNVIFIFSFIQYFSKEMVDCSHHDYQN